MSQVIQQYKDIMKKQEILEQINQYILEEKGLPLKMPDLFISSELDSLGMTLALLAVDAEFPIFRDIPEGVDEFEALDIPNMTMRDLVNKCKLSITNTSTEQSNETAT